MPLPHTVNNPHTNPNPLHVGRQRMRGTVALGFLALLPALHGCGGGGGSATPEPVAGQVPQALAVSQPGELTSYVQGTLRKRLAQGVGAGLSTVTLANSMTGSLVAATPQAAAADTSLRSGTLVQEEGVAEADLLLSRGEQLATLQPDNASAALKLRLYTRDSAGVAQPTQSLQLANDGANPATPEGLMLDEQSGALAVLSRVWSWLPSGDICRAEVCPASMTLVAPGFMRSSWTVQRVAWPVAGTASAGERLSIEGRLVDSRRIGNRLYVVSTHTPATPLDLLPAQATAAERDAAVASVSAANLLPQLRRNGGAPQPLLAETDCYVQKDNGSLALELTTVTVVDLSSPTLPTRSRCFVGGAEALYMSTGSLYLATTRWSTTPGAALVTFASGMKTDIHKFTLAGDNVVYKGSAAVAGHLGWDVQRKSLRMSEHNGDLRVMTYTGGEGWASLVDASSGRAPSPAQLTVLREDSATQQLATVATLPNTQRPALLGKPGEQLYGVRFAGSRAYLVTFRRTDPLYVLDLSNPADPKAMGALELAGFSEQLFPLQGDLLLGVGRSADSNGRITGLQVALFNVQDASAPRLVSALQVGGPGSQSALDSTRHGLNLLQTGDVARVALPVTLADASFQQWQQGLLRYEVNTRTGTLQPQPMLGLNGGSNSGSPGWDRSLQIGEKLYYLKSSELLTFAWAAAVP